MVPLWSSRDLEISRLRHSTIGAQLLLPKAVGGAATEIISCHSSVIRMHQASTQQGVGLVLLWSTLSGTRFAHEYSSMMPPELQTADCAAIVTTESGTS